MKPVKINTNKKKALPPLQHIVLKRQESPVLKKAWAAMLSNKKQRKK